MMKIKTVLCPTDFSPAAVRGSELAVQISRRFNSRLVYHYNMAMWTLSESVPESLLYLEQQQDAGTEARLRRLAETAPESLSTDYRITSGQTHASIVELAGDVDADLIVMGTNGRSGLDHLLIGSTTERVLMHSPVPVLTTKSIGRCSLFRAGEKGREQPETEVVVPIDFSGHSVDTLDYALRMAEDLPVVIHLLHIVEPISWDDVRGYSHFNVPEFQRHRMLEASERLKGLLPDTVAKRAETHVRMGTVVEEIVGYSEMIQADLILMGAKHAGTLREAVFGATSYGVLRASRCPVWVIPGASAGGWTSSKERHYSKSSPVPVEHK